HNNEYQYNYHFTKKQFKVFNASDVPIDPWKYKSDLKIIVKFSGKSFKLTNTTTDTEWTYKKPSNGQETIVLDGIFTTLNGNPASANSDYGTIRLVTELNNFTVDGEDRFDITFSFLFVFI